MDFSDARALVAIRRLGGLILLCLVLGIGGLGHLARGLGVREEKIKENVAAWHGCVAEVDSLRRLKAELFTRADSLARRRGRQADAVLLPHIESLSDSIEAVAVVVDSLESLCRTYAERLESMLAVHIDSLVAAGAPRASVDRLVSLRDSVLISLTSSLAGPFRAIVLDLEGPKEVLGFQAALATDELKRLEAIQALIDAEVDRQARRAALNSEISGLLEDRAFFDDASAFAEPPGTGSWGSGECVVSEVLLDLVALLDPEGADMPDCERLARASELLRSRIEQIRADLQKANELLRRTGS